MLSATRLEFLGDALLGLFVSDWLFRDDLEAMGQLVRDESTNLFAKIPHGEGQTILREALLVADHNAYHLGQLVFLRRALGAWSDD